MNETARNVASIAAAVGVAGLLLPVSWLRAEYQRAASAALTEWGTKSMLITGGRGVNPRCRADAAGGWPCCSRLFAACSAMCELRPISRRTAEARVSGRGLG